MVKTIANNAVEVNSAQLVKNMLSAALLSLEKEGNIVFELHNREKLLQKSLVVIPTGKPLYFPPKSLESRLFCTFATTVEEIVYDWLAVDSRKPWERAVEQVTLPLAIKGLVSVRGFINTEYGLSPIGKDVLKNSRADLETTKKLLDEFRKMNPEMGEMMNRDIESAVKRRTYIIKNREDHYHAPPVLNDESEVDRKVLSAKGSTDKGTIILIILVAIGLVPMLIIYWHDIILEHMQVILLSFVVLVCASIGSGLVVLTKRSINKKILGKPTNISSANDFDRVVNNEPGFQKSTPQVWDTNVLIDVVHSYELPPISPESKKRIDMISLREPEYYNLCRKLLFVMCTSFALLVTAYGFFGKHLSVSNEFGFYFIIFYIFYGYTLIMFNRRFAKCFPRSIKWLFKNLFLYALFGTVHSAKNSDKKETEYILRPTGKLVMIVCWWTLMICISAFKFAQIRLVTERYLFLFAASTIIIGSYIMFKKLRLTLEQKYPYQPPVNLLALRVFGSPFLDDFLHLTKTWQWLGTTHRLDGPDTAGGDLMDVVNYITGHIDRSIIETQEELDKHVSTFIHEPDRQLRFPHNSMQCMSDTWMIALQYLLDKADVVIMDFSYLNEKNKGVAYEVGKLLDQFSTSRLVFLINDTTDMDVLQRIINDAWNTRSPESPNRPDAEPRIRCIHTGVMPERRENESHYDWKNRFEVPIDGNLLVGLIYDSAMPIRNEQYQINIKRDRSAIYWTNLLIPYI